MKVYLDDERSTPDGWVRVYWPSEAIELLKSGQVSEISLDHDLGDDDRGTGYDVVLWIEEQVALHGFIPPKISVHSANVSARAKMEAGIARYKNVATPKPCDIRVRLRLFGCLALPLQRPINVKFKISAAANSDYVIGFSVSRSSRGSV